jgi:hypothetical protein
VFFGFSTRAGGFRRASGERARRIWEIARSLRGPERQAGAVAGPSEGEPGGWREATGRSPAGWSAEAGNGVEGAWDPIRAHGGARGRGSVPTSTRRPTLHTGQILGAEVAVSDADSS